MDYKELYRSKVIDNRTFILADVLKYLFKDTENDATDIAVGYFYASGLLEVEEEVVEFMDKKNGHIRIIMGNETSKETANLFYDSTSNSEFIAAVPQMMNEDIRTIEEDNFLIKLRSWISDNRLEIKIYTGSANYFHAKTYLFYSQQRPIKGETVTGSSNFSLNGLKGNTELNVLGSENFLSLKEWFDSIWDSDEVSPFSVDLLNIIDEYKPELMNYRKYKLIQESYYDFANIYSHPINLIDREQSWVKGLYEHQYTGISQIASKLNIFGTAVLSDGVGLGKTRTAAGVLKIAMNKNPNIKTLLIADRKLHKQWVQEFSEVDIQRQDFDMINREKFSGLSYEQLQDYAKKYNFIIIDEVHQGFKNRDTKSYQKAKFFKKHAKNDLQALLLTATPWNNSRTDVLNIGTMFLNTINIPNDRQYKQYFIFGNDGKVINQLAQNDVAFDEFWEDIYLQRTRKTIGSERDLFAKRNFPAIEIPFEPRKNRLFADNFDRISELKFPYMDPIKYVQDNRFSIGAHQLQLMLLKLADSSWVAFYESILNIINRLEELQKDFDWIAEVDYKNRLKNYFGNKYDLANYSMERQFIQGSLINESKFEFEMESEIKKQSYLERITEIVEDITMPQAKKVINQVQVDIAHDLGILNNLKEEIYDAYKLRDEKYEEIKNLIHNQLSQNNKVIVISQFKRTIKYYSEKLASENDFKDIKIGTVVGDYAECNIDGFHYTKEEILNRFSPRAKQEVQYINSEDEINLVLGTDTISTGQNLQDATVILNLDLPYNPMQLEQRIGRIDRPRQDTEVEDIYIYTFPIYEAIESELKMNERLGQKMQGVLTDTEFDSVVLPEYADYLSKAKYNASDAVEDMLDANLEKSIYNAKGADSHSDQYIESNLRMNEFLQNTMKRRNDVVIDDISFTTGNSIPIAVIKVSYCDINGSELMSENKIINLSDGTTMSISVAEQELYNELTYSIDNTKSLSEESAESLKVSAIQTVERQIPVLVENYNQQIVGVSSTISKLENKVSKKAAMAIRESVRNDNNRTMIMSRLAEGNANSKEVAKLAKIIELVDKDHSLFELVELIANDISRFWNHFADYYNTIKLYEDELSQAESKQNIDIRKANVEKTSFELLLANIPVKRYN